MSQDYTCPNCNASSDHDGSCECGDDMIPTAEYVRLMQDWERESIAEERNWW